MDKENLNLPEENSTETNALHEKQVFSGDPIKPSERTTPAETLPPQSAPLDLNTAAVLDDAMAVRKRTATARQAVRFSAGRSTPKRSGAPFSWRSSLLASGETPAYAAKRIAKEFLILLLFLALVCFGFWAKGFITDVLTDGKYGAVYQSTVYSSAVKADAPVFSAGSMADGYRVADALAVSLGGKASAAPYQKDASDTFFVTDLSDHLRTALPAHEIVVKSDLTNLDLLTQIHESLAHGVPVAVLLAEADRDGQRLQYALVTEMNAAEDSITVDSPDFGRTEYTVEAFIEATRFKNYKDMPFLTTLGLTFGSYAHNTAIFIE